MKARPPSRQASWALAMILAALLDAVLSTCAKIVSMNGLVQTLVIGKAKWGPYCLAAGDVSSMWSRAPAICAVFPSRITEESGRGDRI